VAGQDVQRAGGVAGPVLFTAAWVVSSLRQAGHPAVRVQLSGLAADDARDPQIMVAAFVVLGACLIGFGAALRPVAGRPAGPWLVMAAGAAAVAAGVFRRDQLLQSGPGFAGESWQNQVHDVAGAVLAVRGAAMDEQFVWMTTRRIEPGAVGDFEAARRPGTRPEGMLRAHAYWSQDEQEIVRVSFWVSRELCDARRASDAEACRREAMAHYVLAEQEAFYRGRELAMPAR
jgi:hypothetical protein